MRQSLRKLNENRSQFLNYHLAFTLLMMSMMLLINDVNDVNNDVIDHLYKLGTPEPRPASASTTASQKALRMEELQRKEVGPLTIYGTSTYHIRNRPAVELTDKPDVTHESPDARHANKHARSAKMNVNCAENLTFPSLVEMKHLSNNVWTCSTLLRPLLTNAESIVRHTWPMPTSGVRIATRLFASSAKAARLTIKSLWGGGGKSDAGVIAFTR